MRKFYSLFLALAITSIAFGQTVNTFKLTSGSFNNSANWTLDHPPVAGESAEIPSGRTARLNNNYTTSGIQLKVTGTLDIDKDALIVTTNNAYIQIAQGGRIIGQANGNTGEIFVNNNNRVFNGGTLSGPQFLNATSGYTWVAGTLPVSIKEFTAIVVNASVKVQWTLDKLVSNKTYAVERSQDGKNWSLLAEIAVDGKDRYSFDDSKAAAGINYYRLKSFGLDGSVSYSSIKVVHVGISNTSLKVFPNPAVRTLNVYVNAGTEQKKISAVLVNRNGQVVAQKMLAASNGMIEFGVTHLAEGNYTLNLKGENGYNESRSVIISRK